MSTDLVPRATVDEILARRRIALERYETAYAALQAAADALTEARKAAQAAAGAPIPSTGTVATSGLRSLRP